MRACTLHLNLCWQVNSNDVSLKFAKPNKIVHSESFFVHGLNNEVYLFFFCSLLRFWHFFEIALTHLSFHNSFISGTFPLYILITMSSMSEILSGSNIFNFPRSPLMELAFKVSSSKRTSAAKRTAKRPALAGSLNKFCLKIFSIFSFEGLRAGLTAIESCDQALEFSLVCQLVSPVDRI